jgi:hypothetical protein
MDRGIPPEVMLAEIRAPSRQISYLVVTPKSPISEHEKLWLELPWQKAKPLSGSVVSASAALRSLGIPGKFTTSARVDLTRSQTDHAG